MALPAGRYGVTKNQLLKIKKLPMNTIKLIEELTEKFDLLGAAAFKNSTDVVTDSSDLVESGAVKDIVGWGNKNLLNPDILSDTALTYVPVYVGDGEFTMSSNAPLNYGNAANLFLLAGNVSDGASTANNGVFTGQTRTVTSVNGYVTVASRVEGDVDPHLYYNQLEKGSTATAYEAYHPSVAEYCTSKQLLEDTVGWTGKNLCNYNGVNNVVVAQCKNGVTYTFSLTSTGHGGVNLKKNDNSGLTVLELGPFVEGRNSGSFTADSDFALYLNGFGTGGVSFTNDVSDLQLEGGSTATAYEPYHASVEESLAEKCDNSTIAPTENGTTVQKSGGYAVGSHAIRNGAFITWKNAKAQGEAINDASDYTSGDVASALSVYSTQSNINLANVNWLNTSGGVKYADVLEISDSTKILAATFGNWSSLNNGLVIQPYISSSKKVGLMINDDTYASGTILLHVLYLK